MNIRLIPLKKIVLGILIGFILFSSTLLGDDYPIDNTQKEFEITSNLVYAVVKEEKSSLANLKTLQYEKVPQNKNNFGFEDKIYVVTTR